METAEALEEVASRRADDPLRPVTFVVPTRLAALALRRELAQMAPYAAVRFETLPRLAELAGAARLAAEGRTPLARPIGDYAAGMAAHESRGVFERVRDLPGYARVLRRHFTRLRRGGIGRSSDLRVRPTSDAVAEFLRAFDAFRDMTARFHDDEELFEAAAAAMDGESGLAREIGDLYVMPPAARSAGAARFLNALRAHATGGGALVDSSARRAPRVILAPDAATETAQVVREVLRLLEAGTALHEVAVFHGADGSYGPLLVSAFRRAKVPAVRYPGQPLIETPAGRAVTALLRLPAEDYSRLAVMDFFQLGQAPSTLAGSGGSIAVRPTTWDRVSREAGVTHGRDRWPEALGALAAELREKAKGLDDAEWQAALEADATTSEALTDVVGVLSSRLEPLRRRQPAAQFIRGLRAVVNDYVWHASTGLVEVMEEIDQLGTVAAIGGEFDLETFIAAFDANLRAAAIRERGLHEGVLVADFRMAAGLRFPHVFVCGAFEGAFPAGPGTAALVEERWWAAARAAHPFIEDAEARLEREREAAVRCLAAGSESLTISLAVTHGAGTKERYPAPVVVRAASEAAGRAMTSTDIREGRYRDTVRLPSPLAAAAAGPVLDQFEGELRESIAERQQGRREYRPGHRLAKAVRLRAGRALPVLSEWDGLVRGERPVLPPERPLSATLAEDYATCGFRFFLRGILGLRALDAPEERQTMDPAIRGSIVHDALNRFFREQRDKGRPAPGEPWSHADVERLLAIADEEIARARQRGEAGLAIFHTHERATLLADLEQLLEEDTVQRLALRAVPREFEWRFDGVTIGGRRFRGAVDRVDAAWDEDGAWVIDYKTGRSDSYDLDDNDPFAGGTRLQLGIYAAALAATDMGRVMGRYWFVTRRGGFATRDYEHSVANAERLEAVVRAIDEGVVAGAFPAVPGDEEPRGFKNCLYCDFDRVCSRRRLADYTARANDEAVARWQRVAKVARGASDA